MLTKWILTFGCLRSFSACLSNLSNSVKKLTSSKYLSSIPTESDLSTAAIKLFPVSLIACKCLGAINPPQPIIAKFFAISDYKYADLKI